MSKATRATLSNLSAGVAVSAFHALVSARMPLTMTGTLSQSARSQGQGSMSTFKADSAFMLRPKSPRPFSATSSGSVQFCTSPESDRFFPHSFPCTSTVLNISKVVSSDIKYLQCFRIVILEPEKASNVSKLLEQFHSFPYSLMICFLY